MAGPGTLLARLVLALAAVVATVILAAGLVATNELRDAGDLAARSFERPPSASELAEARNGLDRARMLGADAPALYAEIGLLILTGKHHAALVRAERLVKLEPENFDGWRSIFGLTRQSDPARAERARRLAIHLNPMARRALREP